MCQWKIGLALAPLFAASVAHADNMEDLYFNNRSPALTEREEIALGIAQRWQAGEGTRGAPVAGRHGGVQYVFGAEEPSVVCAVLQVCDIALQPTELVNSIQLGDTARWNVEPAISGSGAQETQHILVKPMDVGLTTSLVVTTDRRTYHIRLVSHREDYMPKVSFTYPEEALAKWDVFRTRQKQHVETHTIPTTGEYLGDLDFAYQVVGAAPWKPLRVYNDGRRTVIQMPDAMRQTEAPTLLVVRKDGNLFSEAETVLVNYRVHGDRFLVDSVFDKAILIAGVGEDQTKVTITRKGR